MWNRSGGGRPKEMVWHWKSCSLWVGFRSVAPCQPFRPGLECACD
jgi:hypothetical protein